MDNCVNLLQEEEIKVILNDFFINSGYETTVAWGHQPGADIIAAKDNQRIIVEVKGCGSRNPMRVNYFLSILGETLQRMDDKNAKYFIALPKIKQYIRLWNRLPVLAKERTTIKLILVDADKKVEFYD